MKLRRMTSVWLAGLFILFLLSGSTSMPAVALGASDTDLGGMNGTNSDPGGAPYTRGGTGGNAGYLGRNAHAKTFAEVQWGGSDVVKNGQSQGPGTVNHSASGPVYTWPTSIPTAQ